MAHMSVPCHERPPATEGHFSSERALAGRGRYYCTRKVTKKPNRVDQPTGASKKNVARKPF